MIRVRIIYRNYKPLHQAYASMVANPPSGIEYIVPVANSKIRKLHKIYRKIRFIPVLKLLIAMVEKILFTKKITNDDGVDVYQYLNLISDNPPQNPYIVDTEHAAGLISFTPDERRIRQAREFLKNPNCKAVTCWSNAALRTLRDLMGSDFDLIASKSHVIYPAIERAKGLKADYEFINPKSKALKMLLVGNQAYLKGTEELLAAVKNLNDKFGPDKLELHIISDDARGVVSKFNLPNVKLYPPTFDKESIMQKFYMPADLFVMPTKQETFGMALLDALACGTAVVATDQFASREIVDDGHDGLLVNLASPVMDNSFVPGKTAMESVSKSNFNSELADEVFKAIERVLNGKIDAKTMGKNGKKKFVNGGKFSVEQRREKLGRIYREVVEESA